MDGSIGPYDPIRGVKPAGFGYRLLKGTAMLFAVVGMYGSKIGHIGEGCIGRQAVKGSALGGGFQGLRHNLKAPES